MATHDFDIANSDGATVRADLNAVIEALATNSSSTAAPPVTFPHMWWMDTTNNLLKQRNAANTAWVTMARKDANGFTLVNYSAEFTAMPTVGGAPIVESGSNADGEWVKWSNGTMQARSPDMSPTTNTAFGGIYRSSSGGNVTWTYPQSFAANPIVPVGRSSFSSFLLPSGPSFSAVTIVGVHENNNTAVTGNVVAHGRWK